MEQWQVIKDGETKCHGTSEKTFPSDNAIATLRAAGYKIYVDGKLHTKNRRAAVAD
jgi:hypothetical protein